MKRSLFVLPMFLLFIPLEGKKQEARKIISSIPELHYNCNNVVDISVHQLSDANEYSFEVYGGEMMKGSKQNQIIISPVSSSVTIKVFLGEKYLGQKLLPVSENPRPDISVFADGNKLNLNSKVSRDLRQLTLVAEYPEGVRKCISGKFKIKEWSAVVLKYNKALEEKRTAEMESMKISDWKKSVKNADRILLEVRKVVKINEAGKEEEEMNMGPLLLNIVFE